MTLRLPTLRVSDRPQPPRTPGPAGRFAIGTAAVLVASGLAACEPGDTATIVTADGGGDTATMGTDDAVQTTILASRAAYESADLVVVGPADDAEAVAGLSADLGVPGLLGAPDELEDELDRLGAETVLVPAGMRTDAGEGREVLEFDPADLSVDGDVPDVEGGTAEDDEDDGEGDTAAEAAVTLLLDPADADGPAVQVARASVEAAGGRVVEAPGADPRATADTVAAARDSDGDSVVALGEAFGDAEVLDARMATARTAPQLPGGGQVAFPGRRMIAAYGSPGVPSLGILGEQDLDGAVDRVQELAGSYEESSDEPVIPAMEIITTVASGQPGADGDYSSEIDPETLRPWIDRAAEEGRILVVLATPGG